MKTLAFVLAAALAAGCTANSDRPAEHAPARPAASEAPAAKPSPSALAKVAPSADYPLKTCVVSGEELGAMGERVAYSYQGTEVQFCCPDCVKEFEKDPAKYLAKIPSKSK